VGTYISSLFIPILHGCDGPIALCSTVVMYFDRVCHPLIVYTMYAEFNGVIMYEKHIPVWRPHGTSFRVDKWTDQPAGLHISVNEANKAFTTDNLMCRREFHCRLPTVYVTWHELRDHILHVQN